MQMLIFLILNYLISVSPMDNVQSDLAPFCEVRDGFCHGSCPAMVACPAWQYPALVCSELL